MIYPNDFNLIIQFHEHRYPQMMPQDYVKLAYQSEFGPEHLVSEKKTVFSYLQNEWKEIEKIDNQCWYETIGNDLCRFHLGKVDEIDCSLQLLTDLFILTAQEHKGTKEGLMSRLNQLQKLPIPGINDFLIEYKASGCPAVHHSQTFRNLYHPHYRLLRSVYAFYFNALNKIQTEFSHTNKKTYIISIDGRCGSGKTFFAGLINRLFQSNVFHTDDYYLPLKKRQDNWEKIPGGNMDFDRFKNEVILPSIRNETVSYQPFDCKTSSLKNIEIIKPSKLVIIEGSYSNHPDLTDSYDLRIFLTCSKEVQEERLKKREGDYFIAFEQRWIPMEENYFNTFGIQQKCDIVIDTSEFEFNCSK